MGDLCAILEGSIKWKEEELGRHNLSCSHVTPHIALLFKMDAIFSQPSRDKFQVLPHTEYITLEHLTPTNVAQNPLDQFRSWFKEVVEGGVVEEPEAMSLSTATLSGIPSARIVLLKQVDSRGFVFFTNYTSRKSQEIIANPYAALVFYWRELHRSVRVVDLSRS